MADDDRTKICEALAVGLPEGPLTTPGPFLCYLTIDGLIACSNATAIRWSRAASPPQVPGALLDGHAPATLLNFQAHDMAGSRPALGLLHSLKRTV
jgi:hypothetical protein